MSEKEIWESCGGGGEVRVIRIKGTAAYRFEVYDGSFDMTLDFTTDAESALKLAHAILKEENE